MQTAGGDDDLTAEPSASAEPLLPNRTIISLVFIGIVLGGWLLYGWHIGQRGLWSSHEGRAAQNAKEILDSGDWLVPRLFTGDPELQKPPLYYWMVAGIGWLQNDRVNAIAVRLPATLSAIACLAIVFWLGWKMWDIEAGIWGTVILACTTRFAWLARVGRIDMPLCLVVVGVLALFWKADMARRQSGGDPPRGLTRLVYLLLAAGVLLKGPVALVLAGLPIASYLWIARVPIFPVAHRGWWKTWCWLRVPSGTLLLLTLTVPWFVAASIATEGAFFWDFFIYHNLERAVGSSEALKSGPVWFYLPRLFVDGFPWSLLLPALWLSLARHRSRWLPSSLRKGLAPNQDPNYLFLFCWAVSQFLFLSFVSFKRADYLLPVFPAIALLLGGWLRERGWRRQTERMVSRILHPRRRKLVALSAAALATITAPLLVWLGIEFQENGLVDTLVRIDVLRDHLNETDLFMISHVERIVRGNGPILFIGGIVIVASVWLVQTGWHQSLHRRLLVGLGLPWVVGFLFQVHVLLPALDPLREMSRFARSIRAVAGPNQVVHYFGKFDSDLAFHIGKPARAFENWEEMAALSERPEECFVVIKASQWEWIERDPRTAGWVPIVDNTKLAFGGHRDHRLLLSTRPARTAQRLDAGKSAR